MNRIVYIIALPFGFLWQHRKFALILFVVGFAFMVYQQQFDSKTPDIPDYISNTPQQIQTLPVFQTTTRYFYVQKYTEDNSNVYLADYYSYDKKWNRYNTIPLQLDKNQIVYRSR